MHQDLNMIEKVGGRGRIKIDRIWRIYKNTIFAESYKPQRIPLHSKWNKMALNNTLPLLLWFDGRIECFCLKTRALKD